MATDPRMVGQKYSTSQTQDEAAYACGLARTHITALEEESITEDFILEIAQKSTALNDLETTAAHAQANADKVTRDLNTLKNKAYRLLGTAANVADTALGATSDARAAMPPRSGAYDSFDDLVNTTRDTGAFIQQYAGAFDNARGGKGLAERLLGMATSLLQGNERQLKTAQEAEAANDALYVARGGIYNDCDHVYRSGRNAFRDDSALKDQFKFQFMKSSKGKTSSSSKSASTAEAPNEDGSSDGLEALRATPPATPPDAPAAP